jgi:MFS family permease
LWVFAERIGAAQHLSLEEVGTYLAIGQGAGIVGPIIAARYGERYGLHRSLAIGSAVMAAGGLLMVYGASAWSYASGVSLLSAAVMFLTPCFRSLMASLDSTGSVIAMSVTFYTVGFGIAPLIVSAIHTSGNDYGSVAWLAAAAFALSGVLAFMSKSHHLQV